jgi:hypothetical protein
MKLNLRRVPLTSYGSYYAIQHLEAWEEHPEGLYLRTMHKGVTEHRIARVQCFIGGEEQKVDYNGTPFSLTLIGEKGLAEFCFRSPDTIAFRSEGLDVRLTFVRSSHMTPVRDGIYEVNLNQQNGKAQIHCSRGLLVPRMNWDGDNATLVQLTVEQDTNERCEGEINLSHHQSRPNLHAVQPFSLSKVGAEALYTKWTRETPELPEPYRKGGELADYMNWACVVRPHGRIKRYAMYSSINWMLGIWSWDHCFHAMAASYHDPELAWDQWMIVFDNQDAFGALPDQFDDHSCHYSFTKPPVHGWALKWLMDRSTWLTKHHLAEAYAPLARWTEWWFEHRDHNGNGIPEYHNGNDCGWDNSTAFYEGVPLESPDLCTHLILQMETLAEIASKLGLEESSSDWKQRADTLFERMMERFWTGERFVARLAVTQEAVASESLLMFVPILLGKRLPEQVIETMIQQLTLPNRFVTPYGLASESLSSEHYSEDGYWRGPIWAPAMLLICEGLKQSGRHELSRDLARRFCDAAAAGGFPENFHAVTGEPLRDPTVTWTSSIFMVMAQEHV